MTPLEKSFYARNTVTVAKELLVNHLCEKLAIKQYQE